MLWTAVKSFQDAATHVISVIYTVEPEEAKEVKLERVKVSFESKRVNDVYGRKDGEL